MSEIREIVEKETGNDLELVEIDDPINQAIEALKRPDLLEYLCKEISTFAPGNDLAKKVMILSGVGINHGRELRLLLTGERGSGKSFTSKEIAVLFFRSRIYDDISAKAPYYLCKQDKMALNKSIVVFDDIPKGIPEEKLAVLKSLTSQSGYRKIGTVNNMNYKEIEIGGSFTVWASCVQLPGDDQFQDRFLVIPLDNNPEFNKLVYERIKERHVNSKEEKETVNKTTRHLELMFNELTGSHGSETIIPFLDFIDDSLFLGYNRGFEQFLTLIECSVLLHKFQRPVTEEGAIIATLDDIYIAWSIMSEIMNLNITPVKVTKTQQKILDVLPLSSERVLSDSTRDNIGVPGKTLTEIQKETGINRETLRRYLRALEGYAKEDRFRDVPELVEGFKSRAEREYYRIDPKSGTSGTIWDKEFVPLFQSPDGSFHVNDNNLVVLGQKGQKKEREYLIASLSLPVNFCPTSTEKTGEGVKQPNGSSRAGINVLSPLVPLVPVSQPIMTWIQSLESQEFTFKQVKKKFPNHKEDHIADILRELGLNGIIFEPRPDKFKRIT